MELEEEPSGGHGAAEPRRAAGKPADRMNSGKVHLGRPRRSDELRQLRLCVRGSAGRRARPLTPPPARRSRAFKPGRDPTWNAEHVTQPPGLWPVRD